MDQDVTVTKPPVDVKQYRYIVLENSLKALLISDPRIDYTTGEDESQEVSESSEVEDADEQMSTSSEQTTDGKQQVRKAAAALAVGVGSFADPRDMQERLQTVSYYRKESRRVTPLTGMQGVSHYLEHMLFMGSKDFPGEADFDDFLSSHSGSTNAYTDCELTNYHFDVGASSLRPALNRFSAFFKTPLCSESALEREVCAVESEFVGVSQNDECRMAAVMSATARPEHPLSTFMWGNKQSLWTEPLDQGIPIRDRILQHWKSFYSASCMNLVVMGGESLDMLEQYVREEFGAVENKGIDALSIKQLGMPFKGSRAFIGPAKREGHHITFTFQLPSLMKEYGKKVEDYWGHLLGHEGPGSLLSALKAKQWATGLSAGVGGGGQDQNTGYYLFQLEVELTSAGLNASPGLGLAAAQMVFEYIAMLKQAGPQEWIWEEMKKLNDINFRFLEEEDSMDTVSCLAANLFCYRPEHALHGAYLFDKWDPALVETIGELLSAKADGMRMDLQTSQYSALTPLFKTTFENAQECQEKWFEMSYVSGDIPTALLDRWHAGKPGPGMSMLLPNPFIATNFDLLPAPAAHTIADMPGDLKATDMEGLPDVAVLAPALILDEPGLRLFHKAEIAFGSPKAVAHFKLTSPVLWRGASVRACSMLLIDCVKDAINEVVYQADQASLTAQVSNEGAEGFQISLYGLNDKLQTLAVSVFKAFKNLKVGSMWAALKEQRCQKHKNAMLDVDKHVNRLRLQMLLVPSYSHDEVQAALEAQTPEDLHALHADILKDCHLEALVEGNVARSEAVAMARSIQSQLSGALTASAGGAHRLGCASLKVNAKPVLARQAVNPDESNSAIQLYLQLGKYSYQLRALQFLCQQVLSERLFNQLRTEQQLGYSVHISPTVTTGCLGLLVSITSEKAPAFVTQAVDDFLDKMQRVLEEMPAQDFQEHVQSVATSLLQAPHNLDEQVSYHWNTIWDRQYGFYSRYKVHADLQKLTKEDLVAFYASKIVTSGSERKQLIISSTSQKHGSVFEAADGYVLVHDISELQRDLQVLMPAQNSGALSMQSGEV